MNTLSTQVIIVGAGPAGAATSIFLSKSGVRHVILEKATFPRDKVCGDACSGKTAFVLRKANPSWLPEIHSTPAGYLPSNGIIFAAPNGKRLRIPYGDRLYPGESAAGFTTRRLVFDQFLFEKIDRRYAQVFQNASIIKIAREGEIQTVTFRYQDQEIKVSAPLIVGADGEKGISRKTLLQEYSEAKAAAVGLRAYYEGVTGFDSDYFVELHFLKQLLPGYFWVFPLSGGLANVGVTLLSSVVRKKKINLREQMLAAIQENPAIKSRFKHARLIGKIQGWGLPLSGKHLPVSGNGFMLSGDAANLIDPFSGEGIGNALYSGMLAAEAAVSAIAQDRFDAAFLKEQYDRQLYRRLGDELRISATLQRLCRYPWLFNAVVNKAHKSPSLSRTISCMFADLDLRDQLRKPSFYARILLNR